MQFATGASGKYRFILWVDVHGHEVSSLETITKRYGRCLWWTRLPSYDLAAIRTHHCCPYLTWLWPFTCFRNIPDTLLSQGLCTCCSLGLRCDFSRYLSTWLTSSPPRGLSSNAAFLVKLPLRSPLTIVLLPHLTDSLPTSDSPACSVSLDATQRLEPQHREQAQSRAQSLFVEWATEPLLSLVSTDAWATAGFPNPPGPEEQQFCLTSFPLFVSPGDVSYLYNRWCCWGCHCYLFYLCPLSNVQLLLRP